MNVKVLLISLFLLKSCNCEYFSATEELKTLKFNNQELITVLKDFSHKIEKLQDDVKRCLEEAENEQNLMQDDLENYVDNPLYGFSLLKRLSYDVDNLKKSLNTLSGYSRKFDHIKLPMSEFSGAVEGIYRLQDAYQLEAEHIAAGIIKDKKLRSNFSPYDLLALGREMMTHNEEYSMKYIREATDFIEDYGSAIKIEFLEEVLMFYESANRYQEALDTIDEILEIDPTISKYEDKKLDLAILVKLGENEVDNQENTENWEYQGSEGSQLKENLILAKACRGELQRSQKELSKLHCRYVSKNYFTLIAPFKVVEMNLEPYVAIFLDVISDNEIEWLKSLAINNLARDAVISNDSLREVSNVRTVKTFWQDDADEVSARLTARVSDMSGLEVKTSEDWVVQNYGLGGHYAAHFDFLTGNVKFNDTNGNRIATALFYLSTVEMGGATVFPLLRLYVPAMKGTAVFWYNLNTSGGGEFKTRHSGCPVLFGSKWVANKWLRERGQEFKRPCELELRPADEDFYLTEYNLEDYGIYI